MCVCIKIMNLKKNAYIIKGFIYLLNENIKDIYICIICNF